MWNYFPFAYLIRYKWDNLLAICIHCDLCRYLVSVCNHRIRELPGHQLIKHNTVGVDVRLETVRVTVLHPDYLRGLEHRHSFYLCYTYKHVSFPFSFAIRLNHIMWQSDIFQLFYLPSKEWILKAALPDVSHSISSLPWPSQSLRSSLLNLHGGRCLEMQFKARDNSQNHSHLATSNPGD